MPQGHIDYSHAHPAPEYLLSPAHQLLNRVVPVTVDKASQPHLVDARFLHRVQQAGIGLQSIGGKAKMKLPLHRNLL